MPKSLEGQKLIQVWQWGPPSQAELTTQEAIQLCLDFGLTGFYVKVIDGNMWMRDIQLRDRPGRDPGDALGSIADIVKMANAVHAAGLFFGVWTNPLGKAPELEAALTGSIAALPEVDAVFLDVEPYDGFWGAWRPQGLARGFMETVRAAAPNAYIVLQPDPRPARFAELRPEEWVPHVDAISGQHYFGVFGSGPEEEMAAALQLGVEWGRPNYPTLSVSNVGGAELARAARYLESVGTNGVCLWRMGTANADHLQGFASFTPAQPTPEPQPPLVDKKAEVLALLDELRRKVESL